MSECSTSLLDRHLSEHDKLVHWVVHRQWLGPLPYLEAVQAGRIGLWRALLRYDPERGHAFSTYAVPAIQRAVWRAVAQAQADESLACSLSLCDPYGPLDKEQTLEEIEHGLVRDTLHDLVRSLPSRLAYVIVARYGLTSDVPQTWAAIAQPLHVTRQRVQQLHVEALLWLAHPARSVQLRRLLSRNRAADYRAYLARLRAWQRAQRRQR
jgi:RNA polymerase sigma factor (sigma-70 family)